ncbi:plastocyanin/azurin family copper-binding protein [Streptomyces sp. NPDC012508]
MNGAKEKDQVTFDTSKLEAGARYAFSCTFPGHHVMEQGAVVVK